MLAYARGRTLQKKTTAAVVGPTPDDSARFGLDLSTKGAPQSILAGQHVLYPLTAPRYHPEPEGHPSLRAFFRPFGGKPGKKSNPGGVVQFLG